MWDIVRDQMWNFIAVLVATAGVLTSIILYWKQRRRKAVCYEVITCTPLLSVKEEIEKDVEILYKGESIEQVHLIEVKIINSGNMPIKSKDYERPFSLNFDKGAQILRAEVAETKPDSLRASVKIRGKELVLKRVLMNKGDSIIVKTLVSGFEGQPKVDGRIVGVEKIQKLRYVTFPKWPFLIGLLGATMICAGLFGLNLSLYIQCVPLFFETMFWLTILGLATALAGIMGFLPALAELASKWSSHE